MKLIKLELFNLFDIFDHCIEFDQDERITIITAPNGYGKTITLKAIHSLFNKRIGFFLQLDFDSIVFSFSNDQVIKITKPKKNNKKCEFELLGNNKIIEKFTYPQKNNPPINADNFFFHSFQENLPSFLEKITAEEWLNTETGETLLFEDLIYEFSGYLPKGIAENYDIQLPDNFISSINSLEVYFIQEQRLVLRRSSSNYRHRREIIITDTIEKYSNDLKKLIERKIGEYAQITQSLDSSFPKRLFNGEDPKPINDLRNNLSMLQRKREKTSRYGLLKLDEDSFLPSDDIEEKDVKVLSLYIKDSEKKLAVFDSLVDRIEIFTEILNKRRFSFKSIEIDKDQGFIFKTNNDLPLKLTKLSSGEQHEVVLLYELLFKAEENSLVLIDEPEISLHIVWQEQFLDDIREIIKQRKIDVVIATHSPQIINDDWDLTVNLEVER